jgi:hypothetical protein
MYAKTINYQCFIEEKDEFINLICNLIFKNQEFYNSLFELYSLNYKKEYDEVDLKLKMLDNLTPEELNIKPQFCLNNKTLELQENLKRKNRSNLKQFNKNIKSQKKMTTGQPTNQTYEGNTEIDNSSKCLCFMYFTFIIFYL